MALLLQVSGRSALLLTVVMVVATLTACLASGQSANHFLDDPKGEASYYADRFAGQKTANGEIFDPSEMTAAHPSLPFGTTVRVTRLDGEQRRTVDVRINDRGPYADERIIDLSEAAAQELGMIEEGVVEVHIEILELPAGENATSSRSSENPSSTGGW